MVIETYPWRGTVGQPFAVEILGPLLRRWRCRLLRAWQRCGALEQLAAGLYGSSPFPLRQTAEVNESEGVHALADGRGRQGV